MISPLPGAHQAGNVALAVRCLELLPPELRPGREAILDGVDAVSNGVGVRQPVLVAEVKLDDEPCCRDVAVRADFAYVVNMEVAGALDLYPPVGILQFAETVN